MDSEEWIPLYNGLLLANLIHQYFLNIFTQKKHKLNAKQRIQCNSLDVYNIMLIYHKFKKWAIGC